LALYWGVGGRTRFRKPVQKIWQINRFDKDNAFDRIIIVVDRDEEEEEEEEDAIIDEFTKLLEVSHLIINEWVVASYTDRFEKVGEVEIMLLIVPFNETGALETVMIKSLEEDDDEQIITQCCGFIDSIKTQKYLLKRREKLKAKLSTIVSIIVPDRAVDSLVDMVKGIVWNKYNAVNEVFRI
jgi:hypothetical protein